MSKMWKANQGEEPFWPQGVKLFKGKMYQYEKLCVPISMVERVIGAHHLLHHHIGRDRLLKEIQYRYPLTPVVKLKDAVYRVKRQCNVCQAAEPPN